MSDAVDCPDIQKLRDYAIGRLPAPQADEVLIHAASCETCLTRITILAKNPQAEILPQAKVSKSGASPSIPRSDPLASTRLYGHGPPEPVSPDMDTFDMEALDPSPRSNAIGRLGPYDVLGVLGHGGMGMVFKAFEESLNREVAIKVLARQLATSSKSRQRFVREAQTAAAIRHPNVVTIHTVSDFRAVPYIVMEHLAGQTLQDRIKAQAPLELKDVLQFGIQIASGLAEAHKHHVIHRDVKPSNIMLVPGDDGERAVIMDFGIARVMLDQSDLTSHGAVMGTPAYMSPEQIRGLAVDPRTDLFSFGAVLFAMIHGRSPFQGGIPLEVARKVAELHTPPLRELHPHVPENLSKLVSRLLEKEPDKRFTTAKEVVQQLKNCLNEVGQSNFISTSSATISSTDETVTTFATTLRKHRTAAWSLTGLVLVLAIGIGSGRDWSRNSGSLTSENGTKTNTTATSQPTSQEPPRLTGTLTVAQDGSGQFRSLGEALGRAGPGAVIRVTDAETYRESITLNDADHWRGITLETTAGATLESASPTTPVVSISGTSDVTLRGFKLIAPAQKQAVVIVGDASGLTLEKVDCDSPEKQAIITISDHGGSTGDQPITIRDCRLNCRGDGQCLWIEGAGQPNRRIVVAGNRLGAKYTSVVIWGTLHNVAIIQNVFAGGLNAINLNLLAYQPDEKLVIQHNTFFGSTYWIGLVNSRIEKSEIAIEHNLILGSNAIEASDTSLVQIAEHWKFTGNVWEAGDHTAPQADLNGRIARRVAKFDLL
ncbi:MAG: protein kinase, partial [Planctomycetales bacterium]|nr:protein kinase [Planctomycetales bacterium]